LVHIVTWKGIAVPKGPPPAWSRRDCSFDHLVVAAINQGYGKVLKYTGIEDEGRAHAIRRGVYRCARHRGVSADAGKSVTTSSDDEMGVRREPGGTYALWYRIHDKRSARKAHLERHGTDRGSWPYNPRGKLSAEEREANLPRDEKGNVVR
jgi:hypothetical protein